MHLHNKPSQEIHIYIKTFQQQSQNVRQEAARNQRDSKFKNIPSILDNSINKFPNRNWNSNDYSLAQINDRSQSLRSVPSADDVRLSRATATTLTVMIAMTMMVVVALAVAVGTYRARQWGATGLVADERMEAGRIRVNGIS